MSECQIETIESCLDQTGCEQQACGCVTLTHTPTGGFELAGTVDVTDTIITGGCEIGGHVTTYLTCHPWEDYLFVLPLDEAGPTYLDRSEYGLDGTALAGFTPAQTDGVWCQTAALLTGADEGREHIILPADGLTGDEWTLTLWANLGEEFYTQRYLYSRPGIAVGHSVLKHLYVILTDEDEETYEVFSDQLLNNELWYHLAVTYRKGIVKLYVNGELSTTQDVGEITLLSTGGNAIGQFGTGGWPDASIMDVRLTPIERRAAYLTAEHDAYCASGFTSVGPWTWNFA